MTDKELLKLFEKPEEEKAYLEFMFGDGKKKIMETIVKTEQFKTFFYKMIKEGHDDEHYAYFHDNKIEEALGTRLSWLSYIADKPIDISQEGDYFPTQACSFIFEDKKYWLITIIGQGALSWVITNEKFNKEYMK